MTEAEVSELTDQELADLPDMVSREENTRKNKAGFPIAKAKADDGLADKPKTALAVTIEEDEIDGEYVVVDTGGNDAILTALVEDGGILKSSTKVRINANRAVKEGGYFAKLEAIL